MSKKIRSLGIMSGTSLDAVDYAIIESDSDLKKLEFKKHVQKKIPNSLGKKLLKATVDKLSSHELGRLHFDLGQFYAGCLKKLGRFDLVGLHGQTVYHRGGRVSFQIGHPGFCSKALGKPVYYDFRSMDVIEGGQGAPFAPFFQKHLSGQLKMNNVAFHNLGGISNLTLIRDSEIRAYDTGPANILLDAWVREKRKGICDKNGNFARKALPDPRWVHEFLKYAFFKKKAPKSTGREEFNLSFVKKREKRGFKKLSFEEQLSTLTEVTALSIAGSYEKEGMPGEIYFYGGGVFNSYLMDRIRFWLPEVQIKTTKTLGWPPQAFEASCFAFLALARHLEKKVHLPRVTGAKKRVFLGAPYY